MSIVRRFLGIGLLLLPAVVPAQEGQKRIRIGAGLAVPWAYIGPDGSQTGFYIEVMKEAARREGLNIEILFRKDGPVASLESGAIDIWVAAVPNEERRKRLYFTDAWWSQDHYLGVLANGPIEKLSDVAGRTVIYSTQPPFTANLNEVLHGAILKPQPDLRQRFMAVCDGSADAVLFYHETALFALTGSNELAACRERGLRLIPIGKPIMEVSMVSRFADKALADRFLARVEQMRMDQTLARLSAYPLTGNQSVSAMLRAEQIEYNHRLWQITVGALLVVLIVVGVAYFRLRRANQQIQSALAAAEAASRVKTEFLATMSHEIRTPMTAVLGYMEMLMGTPLRHDQKRFATEVTQATEALLTLITTILGYARPGKGLAEAAEDVSMDPAAVLDDCLAAVQLEAERKGLSLVVDVDANVPRWLRGDAVRLRQAMLNLIGNAVKFTLSGWVRVSLRYADGYLECEVSDSGVGIPEDQREAIFEPFRQVESTDTRRFGGVGLGLAVVADLCRQLGGTVRTDKEPGGGARFTLRLPYAAGGEELWLSGCGGSGDTAVVLAADSPCIDVFARYLRSAGVSVTRAGDIETMNRWQPAAPGRVFCFVDGYAFGTAVPVWRDSRTVLVLLGRLTYLRGVSEEGKAEFNDVLPLPVATRALRDILLPPVSRTVLDRAPVRQHVLVVDDNAVNRRVLCALLEKLGCRVDTAKNGREAVEAASLERYALILMDCQMPVMNGYEAAEAIRRHPLQGGDAVICAISAALDEATRVRCQASGMNEFLSKPVTLDVLQDLLTRVTARQIIAENLLRNG